MSTHLSVVGTVATAPRLITTAAGITFCTFRIASNERRFDREQNQWVDGETNWFTVNAFRTLAENADRSFRKGDRVLVNGRLRVRSWNSDQKSGTSVEIEAEALGHDLRWGTSRFEKQHRPVEPPAAAQLAASNGFGDPPHLAEHEAGEHDEPGSEPGSGSESGSESESGSGSGKADELLLGDGFVPPLAA
ncbi:single-stranded DNA-binding protein [Leucobacter chironomi]|uniref:single-stranded DNA-binding protein n=1 Tax=Leucobacter chironomi TaxID=491918 RepID=UPI00042738A4|nr:single-stranded DNA-binding protein [Leucobacter chironomi]